MPCARAEIDADYSTTTELADVLQRDAGVPFRAGHHFASELVNYGRGNGLAPAQIPYTEAVKIYAAAAQSIPGADSRLPLSEAHFREALSADNMVRSSLGLGGPQPEEVKRMLGEQAVQLQGDQAWLNERRSRLGQYSKVLDTAFERLRN